MSQVSSSSTSARQPNRTSYIKTFTSGVQSSLWKSKIYKDTTSNLIKNVIFKKSILNSNIPNLKIILKIKCKFIFHI